MSEFDFVGECCTSALELSAQTEDGESLVLFCDLVLDHEGPHKSNWGPEVSQWKEGNWTPAPASKTPLVIIPPTRHNENKNVGPPSCTDPFGAEHKRNGPYVYTVDDLVRAVAKALSEQMERFCKAVCPDLCGKNYNANLSDHDNKWYHSMPDLTLEGLDTIKSTLCLASKIREANQ